MYELFLTSAVKDDDFEMACAVLQGLCWMTARHNVYRTSFFAGAPQPRGLPGLRAIHQTLQQRPREQTLWSELGRELSRSSYVFQLAHEVSPARDFGADAVVDLNAVPGTLHWREFPDPHREKDQLVTYRRKIDIPGQKNLLDIMANNAQAYKSGLIRETYTFVRDNMEFALTRWYHIPGSTSQQQQQQQPGAPLPAWSELRPVDPARKWIFTATLNVVEDGQPETLKRATEEVLRVKTELEQMFDFRSVDRRVFETRIAKPVVVPK